MKNTNKKTKIRFKVGDKLVGKPNKRDNTWLRVGKNKWKASERNSDGTYDEADDEYCNDLAIVASIYDFVPALVKPRKKKSVVKQPIVKFFYSKVNKFRYIFIGDKGICIGDNNVFLAVCSVDHPSLVELKQTHSEFPEVMNLLRSIK